MTTTWKLVPAEPTPEMLTCIVRRLWPEDGDAGKRLQAKQRGENRVPFKAEYEWSAGQYLRMLAASPPPPETVLTTEEREAVLFDAGWPQSLVEPIILAKLRNLLAVHERAILRKLGGGVK